MAVGKRTCGRQGAAGSVRLKLWLLKDGGYVCGPGLAGLLEGLAETGSLAGAARRRGISYRHAWDVLQGAAAALGRPLAAPRVGGAGGGGSSLTPAGRAMLRLYREVSAEVAAFAEERFLARWRRSALGRRGVEREGR